MPPKKLPNDKNSATGVSPSKNHDALQETLAELKSLGDEKVRARSIRAGGSTDQFGVLSGDLRKVAKRLKTNHALALALWDSGNMDARMLAILVMEPKKLSAKELERLVATGSPAQVADWLNSYIVKEHPEKESLRQAWMTSSDPWLARSAWGLTSARVGKNPDGLDLPALLDRIEGDMPGAPPEIQWTMNMCLATIGIHFSEHRRRAVAIGEKLGIYRDYPVSKGCTSPFAPIWIAEMVKRNAS